MNELTKIPDGDMMLAAQQAAAEELRVMREMLATMAGMLQATNQSMAELQRQVRLLEKVTPAQASALNRAIRERGVEICAIYMARGGEQLAATAIRRAFRQQFGVKSAKELPRCDYENAMEVIQNWDDYQAMKKIRERVKG
jgi:hypothetical protein